MTHHAFFNPLEKAFRFYAGLYLAIILFQGVGLLMYIVNVWPRVRLTISTGVTVLISLAVVLGLVASLDVGPDLLEGRTSSVDSPNRGRFAGSRRSSCSGPHDSDATAGDQLRAGLSLPSRPSS